MKTKAAGPPAYIGIVRGYCERRRYPDFVTELQFHPTRKWRFDIAFQRGKIAIEIDGGTFTGGRHTRGVGFTQDREKCNAAVMLGWRVFHFTTEQLNDGALFATLDELFGSGK